MPPPRDAPRPQPATIRVLNLLVRHAGLVSAVLGMLVLLSQLHLVVMLAPLKPNVVALQLAFSAPRFWGIAADWGVQGLQLYRSHFAYDLPHTLLYGAWGALMVVGSGLFTRWSSRQRWAMAALMPAAAVFDLIENAGHLSLLAGPAGQGATLVALASICSLLKWLLVALYLALLLWRCLQVWGPPLVAALELRLPPLALGLLGFAALGALGWLRPAWRSPLPGLLPLAITLALAGLVLMLLAQRALRQAGTTLDPQHPDATRHLVTAGIYGACRHPMYLGLVLLLAAAAAWLGQWAGAAVPLLVLAWLQRFQVLPEERALAASFGPAFRLYSAAVWRGL